MSESKAAWWRQKDWWIDHWADVIGAIVIPLMLYMIDCNNNKAGELLVRKQIDIQQQSKNESAAEADNHQAIQLLSDLGTRIGSEQLPQRRAIAEALLGYSTLGRLYHPSTIAVIDYIKRECDATTHDLLRQAVEGALNQTPKNAVIPSCGDKSVDGETSAGCAKRKKDALTAVKSDNDGDREKLNEGESMREQVCQSGHLPASVEPTAAVLSQYLKNAPRTFRQYVDVGCGETNQATLQIPLTDDESKNLKLAGQPSAHFEGVSNLNWDNIDKIDVAANVINVTYSIRGLDRQLFGNCPGGGHATVVVEYQLTPIN